VTSQTAVSFPELSSPASAPASAPAPALESTLVSAPDSAPASVGPPTWAQRWLGNVGPASWAAEGCRLLLAIALASLFGVALGLRSGGLSIALAALGAPAGIAAVAAVAVPAFAIVLSLANAPVEIMDLARATSRASIRAGLFLAGLAPGVALLVVTVEEAVTVTVAGFGALALAGGIAASSFASDLQPRLAGAPRATRVLMSVAMPAFLLFAAVLAARVWWLALPMLTETP
jgi:hypothetical protein